jgi:hypothetical protein
MENRSVGRDDPKELAFPQTAAGMDISLDEPGDASLSHEELHRLIEFFRLLDHWDRDEVVQ